MKAETLIIIFSVWAFTVSFLLMMVIKFAPVIPFLVARFNKNKVVMAVISKANRINFVIANVMAGGFETKKQGIYDESANSGYYVNRVPIFFSYAYYSHTIPLDWPTTIQTLRDMGKKIITFADVQQLWSDFKFKKAQKDYETCREEDKEYYLGELNKAQKEYEDSINTVLTLPAHKTIRIGDLQHMFPAIDDPHIREKEKAADLVIQNKLKDASYRNWILLVLIGGVVAFIVWKLFLTGGAQTPVSVVCEYPELIRSAVASNITI